MFQITKSYDTEIGPVVSAIITDPVSERESEQTPRLENVSLLVDSGASDTSISGAVIDRLGLSVLGLYDVHDFGSFKPRYQYMSDLEIQLDKPYTLLDFKVLRFDTHYDKIQGILGRDIIGRGTFYLDGLNGRFTLELPEAD